MRQQLAKELPFELSPEMVPLLPDHQGGYAKASRSSTSTFVGFPGAGFCGLSGKWFSSRQGQVLQQRHSACSPTGAPRLGVHSCSTSRSRHLVWLFEAFIADMRDLDLALASRLQSQGDTRSTDSTQFADVVNMHAEMKMTEQEQLQSQIDLVRSQVRHIVMHSLRLSRPAWLHIRLRKFI